MPGRRPKAGHFDTVPDALDATLHPGYIFTDPARWVEERRDRTTIIYSLGKRWRSRWPSLVSPTRRSRWPTKCSRPAENADNPQLRIGACVARGFAHRDADPAMGYEAHRRGLAIAEESGNRQLERINAVGLSRLAAAGPVAEDAFPFLTRAVRSYYDSGSFSMMSPPLAILAA